MLTHLEFIFVKYALKVELCSLNLALPWRPTEVVGCEISKLQSKKSFCEIFSLKTYLVIFRFMNGSECGGQKMQLINPGSYRTHVRKGNVCIYI